MSWVNVVSVVVVRCDAGWIVCANWKWAEWVVGGFSYAYALVGGCLLLFRVASCSAAVGGQLSGLGGYLFDVKQPTQNWHGPGESDCLIKTKHCDVC